MAETKGGQAGAGIMGRSLERVGGGTTRSLLRLSEKPSNEGAELAKVAPKDWGQGRVGGGAKHGSGLDKSFWAAGVNAGVGRYGQVFRGKIALEV